MYLQCSQMAVYSEWKLPFKTPPFKGHNLVLEKVHITFVLVASLEGTHLFGGKDNFSGY